MFSLYSYTNIKVGLLNNPDLKLLPNWENPPSRWRSIHIKIYLGGVAFGKWDFGSWFVARVKRMFPEYRSDALFEIENNDVITGMILLDKGAPVALVKIKIENRHLNSVLVRDTCVVYGRTVDIKYEKILFNYIDECLTHDSKNLSQIKLNGKSRLFGWDGENCFEGHKVKFDKKINQLLNLSLIHI